MSEWRVEGDALVHDFEFENFARAMAFVNQVAEMAEAANHHPDILVHGWNKVRITLTTHSAGGITQADHGPWPGRSRGRVASAASLDERRRLLSK